MNAKQVFTEELLKALQAPSKGYTVLYDHHRDAPRGFGYRITANDARVFFLRYFHQGRERKLTIGDHGKNLWSLAAARKEAGNLKQTIDRGTDIVEQRRAERAEKTFADVAEDYCVKHADHLKSAAQVRGVLDNHALPVLGKRKLSTIRRAEIIELVEGIAKQHPRAAALALLRIKQVFAFAEDRELIEANPAATIKPAKVSRRMTPKSRGRVLDDAEILALWGNAEGCGIHRMTALALKLILVTGQRPGEVAGMRWDEVDGAVWTIPASRRGKTETEHSVPLTGTALALLEKAKAEASRLGKRRKKKPAGYVFEARPGVPVTTAAIGRAVARYTKALSNRDVDTWGHWTPHDLRRTCRTGLAGAGVTDTVAEAVVGHTRKGIIGVYDRHRYDDEKRAALETWERRLLRIVGYGTQAKADATPIIAAGVSAQ